MGFSSSERSQGHNVVVPDYLYKGGDTYGRALGLSGLNANTYSSPPVFSSPTSAFDLLRRRTSGRSMPRAEGESTGNRGNGMLGSTSTSKTRTSSGSTSGSGSDLTSSKFMIPSASEPGKIEMYSAQYFYTCGLGGSLCCGLTHWGMTPVDVVKCNMQIAPTKYKSIFGGFRTVIAEEGVLGLTRGWLPTLLGYSIQGAGKLGFYEFFKYYYAEKIGPEAAKKNKTLLYLSASASAEFLADIGLCPLEAVKVRVQTQPGFAKGLSDGLPKLLASDGYAGLYKGIGPLWGRQIPYTMMKFVTFENTVEYLYKSVLTVPKEEVSKTGQLGVSFVAGYIAGIACAVISHPADNLVSYLNNQKGATVSMALKDMGTLALFTRGLPLRIFMIGTLTAAQWGIYDAFKVYVGLPTTGGH